MKLTEKVKGVLSQAEKIKGTTAANEANTRAVLIEPLMESLGWDTGDPEKVTREYKVFDGTFLDYALLIDGQPRLFLEAKALGKNLDDANFVSQTVNYANNEGVIWCVLTNGLVYRVYKTNEPVGMNEKLLFEINLEEADSENSTEVASRLEILRPKSIEEGQLDAWGEQVFADQRVRSALNELAESPPPQLMKMIGGLLGNPKLEDDLIQSSFRRVVAGSPGAKAGRSSRAGKGTAPGKSKEATPKSKKEFPLEHHTDGKPASVVDLFRQVDSFATSLGTDVTRRSKKMYVAYFVGKRSFFTMELQKTRIWVYLGLDPSTASPWNPEAMRDVREIGHYGLGDTEYNLVGADQLGEVEKLIELAYESRR